MSTQINLGAAYLVSDFYQRFFRPDASERELVWAARTATFLSLFLGCLVGFFIKDASQGFKYLLLLGAGTGAIYIMRWFWWRINAFTEIIAMVASLIVASIFTFYYPSLRPENLTQGQEVWWDLSETLLPVIITTIAWIAASFLTPATNREGLINFYQKVRPGGPGWSTVRKMAEEDGIALEKDPHWSVPLESLCALLGCLAVYAAIYSVGSFIYGQTGPGVTSAMGCALSSTLLVLAIRKIPTPSGEAED